MHHFVLVYSHACIRCLCSSSSLSRFSSSDSSSMLGEVALSACLPAVAPVSTRSTIMSETSDPVICSKV